MQKPFFIGLTGGSGSGKTSFLKQLVAEVGAENICLFSQDNYYFPIETQEKDAHDVENFDMPQSIDLESFKDDIFKVAKGETVVRDEYVFNNLDKEPGKVIYEPRPIILIEGLFAFYVNELKEILDLKLFIETKDLLKLKRRILRDKEERGYDVEDVLYRYEHHVMPSYEKYIKPHRDDADLIVCNNQTFEKALHVLSVFLKTKIHG